ncbi:MAG: TonB-dependent receptor [Dysgonamonadaceae bacterium]|nr:TonB-dependent receptor [Dysgonamonadaceae bacterium]
MRVAIIFLTVFSLNISATIYSQNTKLSLNVRNKSIKEILFQIENMSEYRFIYQSEKINLNRKVSVRMKDHTVESILDRLFENAGVEYEITENNLILISPDNISVSQQILQQKINITGTIVDEQGEPVIGANIVEKGTANGVISNINGEFSITVPNIAVLQVSYIGYILQDISVRGRTSIRVVLTEDTHSLEEVIVVGYGTQKRANITGAVSTVNAKELVKAPSSNVSQNLSGRLPGLVSKQNSGEPGNDQASLSIRGFGGALVIVDGVESSLNYIDQNEIESVTILKDASAAIYGARAGNGVILITTKRGGQTKPTINVNTSLAFQGYTSYPMAMNAAQYVELHREAQLNSGTPESGIRFSAEAVRKWQEGTESGYQGADWWSAVMNKYSPLQQHNVSLSGGNEKVKYYTFLGYTGQTGMYKSGDNEMNRYNIRSNVDGKVNNYLSVGFDISYINSDLRGLKRDQGNIWQDLYEHQPVYMAYLPDPDKIPYGGAITSIVASTHRDLSGYNDVINNQLSTTVTATLDIPKVDGLSIKGLFNYKYDTRENKIWEKGYRMYEYDLYSDVYTEYSSPFGTTLNESYSRNQTLTGQISINYDHTFSSQHYLSALFLTELIDYDEKWISAGRAGYITDAMDYLFAGGADMQYSDGRAAESARISYVGRINYAYQLKYLLEATMRYDGSPKFPESRRWGFFPSVSAGWRLSEESFMKENMEWINNLKFRASFSSTGFDGIGAFQYLTGYRFANRYIVNNTVRNGLVSTGLANPNITWEEMIIYNAGLDFSLLRNSLYGELDVFYRDRSNILANRLGSLPNTFGATLPMENINSMNTRGCELKLGYRSGFNGLIYDVSANISWSRSRWDHFEEPDYSDPADIRINKQSGNWTNRVFGYKTDGLFVSQDEIDNHDLDQDGQGNATIKTGDVKYIDIEKDGILDWKDKIEIGTDDNPEINYGLNINLAYKGFDFSALFQGTARRDVLINLHMANDGNNPQSLYELRWTEENNVRDAEVPRVYLGPKANNQYVSDYWLKSGNYLRLKTLSLGYNFSQHWMSRIGFTQVRLYMAGTNVFTISNLRKYGLDPETPSNIRAGFYYPQQRTYSFGINLTF